MTRLPKWKLVSLLALCFALLTASASAQGPTRVAVPDDAAISDAYIYLLGRVLVIRQEHMDRGAVDFAYNAMKYDPIGEADWVNPNLDTAYIEAWFAVDPDAPVIFEVPEIEGRYYTAQILDEWGEVIANINERMFPSKPFGKFALVYPNSNPKIPADATRIDLHSAKAKLLGRVEIKGDKDGATKLQHGFKATAAGSSWRAHSTWRPMRPRCSRRSALWRPTLRRVRRLTLLSMPAFARPSRSSSNTRSPKALPIAITGSAGAEPGTMARTICFAPSPIMRASGPTRAMR
jgi:hypothetical protein